jgi:hypothetical protein
LNLGKNFPANFKLHVAPWGNIYAPKNFVQLASTLFRSMGVKRFAFWAAAEHAPNDFLNCKTLDAGHVR